ncbi:hypothetical protein FB565_007204 [Actinoplanes lutulentus]|uniref:Uncharacterized protein n=1 Tax=Actinoplanes lutulentus TaxID=1287878 RepID=A0A327ZB27_9ACTN|nr:DUF6882 domain-containing protein [Actinoplanes lutulentus]MBB2947436.1 hypothetical protein [Actinoplanes lutulentus]RAK36709.1 hypothetical protein B0I29_108299 [Actinoplanes lutulentus]
MSRFEELFTQHVATAFARQLALADLIGECDWQLDLTEGVATFGEDLRYPVQLLGTESHGDGTWLWAWANTGSNLPAQVVHLSEWLRGYGDYAGVTELTEASFPLERADGARLALIASGLTGRCYYRGPYDGGAVFFHVEGLPPALIEPVSPERAFLVLGQVIQAFPVDHRAMLLAFLEQQGWSIGEDGPGLVVGHHPGGSEMRVEFDEQGRIERVSGQIQPA